MMKAKKIVDNAMNSIQNKEIFDKSYSDLIEGFNKSINKEKRREDKDIIISNQISSKYNLSRIPTKQSTQRQVESEVRIKRILILDLFHLIQDIMKN